MTDLLLQAAGVLASALIFWRAESVLNLLAPGCRLLVRVAFWLLVVGAASFALRVLEGYTPTVGVVLTFSGIALLLVSERRVRALLRFHTPTPGPSERRTLTQ